ncbi:hypothetical protein D9756_009080 [Leucocoprinus leucothites]|uniref:N-acetyltransferase domain-containing protein n=1 Tax=Leucocoprinus leucothites TaxID=201217 RepID=A0A8H5CXX8_9AGAR|nr:hypothetical protein D9756_009080 [Leucoagaricus leucothites]
MSDFDPNFCFSVPSVLENARLRLVPWNPDAHSTSFVEKIIPHPELFNWLPFGPFDSRESFDPWFHGRIQSQKSEVAFAVFDKTRNDSSDNAGFAGMIGLLNASESNISVEMGFLIILPAFHRTHVASNAVGLLLQYCLNTPSSSPNDSDIPTGLGLRRVYWSANTLNARSIALAERLGMKLEVILRWDRVLPPSRAGFGRKETLREGDPKPGQPGRDTARLAICWDDWVEGGADRVQQVMQRVN